MSAGYFDHNATTPIHPRVADEISRVSLEFPGNPASPYAAAGAALLLEVNPALTAEDIRSLMKTNGPTVTNPDNGLAFTRTNIASAVLAAVAAVCGNGILESGEDCDDGGTVDGDCCSVRNARDGSELPVPIAQALL